MNIWSNDSQFLETFRIEAEERLQELNQGLMLLEKNPGDDELIKRLFREAHTLKGSAGMMGLDSIRELAHRVEDILASIQKGQLKMSGEVNDLLLETLDRIEEMLPSVDEPASDAESDVSELLDRLGQVEQAAPGAAAPVAGAAAAKTPASKPATETTGPADARRDVRPPAVPKVKPADTTIRVNIDRLDGLLNLMGEILVNQLDAEHGVRDLSSIQSRLNELDSAMASLVGQVRLLREAGDTEKLEKLSQKLNKAQDLFAAVTNGLGSAISRLNENTAVRRLALDELQDQALHVRMLPLSTIFGLYPRVVRDAAKACGKKVQLKISGEKTELDKHILEELADPLMHIIRNCVDHGVEFANERVAAGKEEQGLVHLSAAQRGDRVEITVTDDGGGIDPARVKAAAVNKGLIGRSDDLTDAEAMEMIFWPGFSTAEAVTAISGRGVGLDVVKNNIEKLEGNVTVESSPGSGTRFVISLPVTLAVIPGFVVSCGGANFVIPMAAVRELVSVPEQEIQSLGNQRGFLMRGSAVPLVDLSEHLGGGATGAANGKVYVAVVGAESQLLGLQVENLIGEQEIVIKPLGSFLPRLPYIAGATILGDGEVVLVLNINQLVRGVRSSVASARTVGQKQDKRAASRGRKSVLVVEDSLVVRELQKNILEAAGFLVETAVDGNDSLAHLSQGPVDCVITDVEMPGMDGFHLTSAIRHTEEIKEIPVVIVSSRNSEEDKKKGVEAGANAYVVKGSFDQQGLLNTIERLVA